jgi:hypothetical protein
MRLPQIVDVAVLNAVSPVRECVIFVQRRSGTVRSSKGGLLQREELGVMCRGFRNGLYSVHSICPQSPLREIIRVSIYLSSREQTCDGFTVHPSLA